MASSISFDIFAHDHASSSLDNVGDHASRLGSTFGKLGKGLAIAGGGIVAGLGFAAATGIKTAASMEQASVAFTTLLGSGQKAKTFLGQLQTFAAATPFEFPGLVDASRQLLGAGASASSVIPTLTAFGDASGALGLSQDNFNHIMLATTQAMSAGKFQAGDLLQITEAGLPVWKLLSEALHKPVSEVRKLSEGGKLLTANVLPLLQKQMEKDYGGSMAKQSQTLTGIWSTLMDTFNMGLAKVLVPLLPMLKNLATGGIGFLGKVFGFFSNTIMPEVIGGFRAFVAAFKAGDGDVTSSGFPGFMERVANVARKVFDYLRVNGPIVFAAVRTAITNVASIAIPLIVEGWRNVQKPLATVSKFITGTLIPGFVSLTGWLKSHATVVKSVAVAVLAMYATFKVITVATRAFAAAQTALNLVMSLNPIGVVILAIAGLAAGLIYAYKHSETFRNVAHSAFHMVATAIDFVKDHWKLLITLILGPFGAAIALVVTHWSTFRRYAVDAIGVVLNTFMTMAGAVIHGAAAMFGWVPGVGGKLKAAAREFDKFRDGVNHTLDTVRGSKTVTIHATSTGFDYVSGQMTQLAVQAGYLNSTSVDVKLGSTGGKAVAVRALGGPVRKGEPYVVGEHRPELFVPDQNGTILPRVPSSGGGSSMQSGQSGGQALIVNIHVAGSVVSEGDLIRAVSAGIEQRQKRLGVPTIFGQAA